MLVSVIIPAYDSEKYIREAVESVIRESASAHVEAVIVEDGSTDGTLAICEKLRERHPDIVSLYRHPDGGNHGVSATRNLGIEKSRGGLIAFLDADDYWLPGRLDKAVAMLADNPEVDGVYEAVEVQIDAGEGGPASYRSGHLLVPVENADGGDLVSSVLLGHSWHTAGVLLRKEALEAVGGFPPFSVGEDLHVWARLAAAAALESGQVARPVAVYRRHERNTYSGQSQKSLFDLFWNLSEWFRDNVKDPGMRWAAEERLLRMVSRHPESGLVAGTLLRAGRLLRIATAFPRTLTHWTFYRQLKRVLTLHVLRQRLRASGRQRGKGSTCV